MRSLFTFTDYLVVQRSLVMLVALVGTGFAIIRWNRHPRVSLMTTIALCFYFIESWTAQFFFASLPWGISDTTLAYLHFFEDFAFAAVLILLFITAFIGRRRSAKAPAT